MGKEKIKDDLDRLHQELGQAGELDSELREGLKVLVDDINRVLADDDAEKKESIVFKERTENIAAKFATEHPRVEMILNELADTLSKIGI